MMTGNMGTVHAAEAMRDTARYLALFRAAHEYGDTLTVSRKAQTVHTLQGRQERGYIVWGRAYGGDYLGVVFHTPAEAHKYIASVMQGITPYIR